MRVWWFFAREVAGSLVIGNSVLPSSDGQGPHSRRTAHLDQERGNCAGGRSCPAQRLKPSLHCWSLVQPRVPMMHQRRVIPCRSSCFSSGVVREAEKHPHRRQVRLFQQRTDALTVNTRQRFPCSSHPKFVNTRVRLCGKEKEDFVTLQFTVQTLGGRIRHSRSPCWNVDLEHIGAQGGMRKSILAAKLARRRSRHHRSCTSLQCVHPLGNLCEKGRRDTIAPSCCLPHSGRCLVPLVSAPCDGTEV